MGNACCGEEQKPNAVFEEPITAPALSPQEDQSPQPLRVIVLGAHGLLPSGTAAGREGYCTCQVRGKEGSLVRTTNRPLDPDPTWEEEFELPDWVPGDAVEFAVLGARPGGALGTAMLHPKQAQAGFAGSLVLVEAQNFGAHLAVKAAQGGEYPEMPAAKPDEAESTADEYQISVKKVTLDDKIGVDIVPQGGSCLRVKLVKQGLIKTWNQEHQTNHVQPGDFIVAVNGARGSSDELLERIARDTELEIVLRRLA